MSIAFPVRLGPAETTLIEQLNAAGATAEAERLSGSGLPTRRVEAYHYTDLKQLLRAVPQRAGTAEAASAPALRVPGAYQLMIANGVVQESGTAPVGVIAGKTRGGVLTTRDDIVTRLNNALVGEALTLDLNGSVDPVIQIDRRTEGAAGHSASAAKIFVGDDTSVVILETYSGSDEAHLGNHATYLAIGRNAQVTHITVNLAGSAATHFASNEYHLAEGARLRTLVINAGGALSRTQLFPRYEGAGAHADMTGLNLVGDGQHTDLTMDALHAVPNTSSKPLFKSIARGRSRAVVQGRLVVARDAQKTDAKLMSQGLMLSGRSGLQKLVGDRIDKRLDGFGVRGAVVLRDQRDRLHAGLLDHDPALHQLARHLVARQRVPRQPDRRLDQVPRRRVRAHRRQPGGVVHPVQVRQRRP